MSSFAVEVVRLDAVETHPNADALELAVIGGYRAVVQKGLHKAGDLVVYVPEAALVPADIIEAFGFTGKLSGSGKNRVKAIRLRGELSQGLVLPLKKVLQVLSARGDGKVIYLAERDIIDWNRVDRCVLPVGETSREDGLVILLRGTTHVVAEADLVVAEDTLVKVRSVEPGPIANLVGVDLAPLMGIEKYEPSIPTHMQGKVRQRPDWFPMYTDVENIKKYNRTFVEGEEVVVTEKIHGTNFGAGMNRECRDVNGDPELFVSSRRCMLLEDETNLYWRAAREAKLKALLTAILDFDGVESVVIFGEVFGHGVQDLAYGRLPGSIGFRWFDVFINGKFLDEDEANHAVVVGGVVAGVLTERVPVLYRGPFSEKIVADFTDGRDSVSNSHVREGVVIKPVQEREGGRSLRRVILKSVSSDYLTRKGGTEYN